MVYAGFWWRVLGYLIDGLIVGVPTGIVSWFLVVDPLISYWVNQLPSLQAGSTLVLPTDPFQVVPAMNMVVAGTVDVVAALCYFTVLVSLWGRTVGQAVVGARVVREKDLRSRLPLGRALARSVVFWVPAAASFGGFWYLYGYAAIAYPVELLTFLALLWAAWDPRKQGIHDKLGRALVVRDAPLPAVLPYGQPVYSYMYPAAWRPGPPPGPPLA